MAYPLPTPIEAADVVPAFLNGQGLTPACVLLTAGATFLPPKNRHGKFTSCLFTAVFAWRLRERRTARNSRAACRQIPLWLMYKATPRHSWTDA